MKVAAIVAIDKNWAIGRQGGLLCHLPADLRHFKSVTMGYPIIMGRKTFESFPRGPLPGRLNIVLTHNDDYRPSGVTVCHNMNEALAIAQAEGRDRTVCGARRPGALSARRELEGRQTGPPVNQR